MFAVRRMFPAATALLISTAFLSCARAGDVQICAGEGPRYGDFKCNHDGTHRVCATLVANHTSSCDELKWGSHGTFWQITGQQAFNWKDRVCAAPNPGTNWCICMWAFASLIKKVGCDNTHVDCAGTDLKFVLSRYNDGGYDLKEAHACLQRKCTDPSAKRVRPSGVDDEL